MGSPAAVSIKLITSTDRDMGNVRQVTLARDYRSRAAREYLNNSHEGRLADFTPFKNLAEGSEAYFISNDLKSLHLAGQYSNPSRDWQLFYNATMVVPIPIHLPSGQLSIIGFVVADSLEGQFSAATCYSYMAECAFNSSLHLHRIDRIATELNKRTDIPDRPILTQIPGTRPDELAGERDAKDDGSPSGRWTAEIIPFRKRG
jgi:hypothetical protein